MTMFRSKATTPPMEPPSIQKGFANALSKYGKTMMNHPKEFSTNEEAKMGEEINFTCGDCHSLNSLPICYNCNPEEVMPVVSDLLRDIPDDDEGDAERSSEQRRMRVHRHLGHPSNLLLVQLLKEAKAPESVIEIATKLECPHLRSLRKNSPSETCESISSS